MKESSKLNEPLKMEKLWLRVRRYQIFFLEKFYETDFKKITPRAPMGSRIFDLAQILEKEKLPGTQEIAELLNDKTWS